MTHGAHWARMDGDALAAWKFPKSSVVQHNMHFTGLNVCTLTRAMQINMQHGHGYACIVARWFLSSSHTNSTFNSILFSVSVSRSLSHCRLMHNEMARAKVIGSRCWANKSSFCRPIYVYAWKWCDAGAGMPDGHVMLVPCDVTALAFLFMHVDYPILSSASMEMLIFMVQFIKLSAFKPIYLFHVSSSDLEYLIYLIHRVYCPVSLGIPFV